MLDHSKVLIWWKPSAATQPVGDDESNYCFMFGTRIVDENTNKEPTFSDSEFESSECVSANKGQYEIHSLDENTLYEVVIHQYDTSYKETRHVKT